jgi:hypothetical protein
MLPFVVVECPMSRPSPSTFSSLPRRAVLTGSLAAVVASIPPALGAPAPVPEGFPEAVRDAIALCWRADQAVWVEIRSEGEPGYEAACESANALHLEIELLRSRTLSKSPKTWDDVAVLAVIALYWERGNIKEFVEEAAREPPPEDILIGCGDRALPTVLLAVLEVLGIRLDTFSRADSIPS